MKMPKDWMDKASRLDFDPQAKAQQRVWARLNGWQPRRRPAWALAWGMVAVLLVLAGGWAGVRWSAYLHCPAEQPTAPLQNAQCKKADGRWLISTQLECNGTDCSCTKTLTICDEHPVTRVTRQTCTNAAPDFNPQDPWSLLENRSQDEIKNWATCQNQC